MIGIKDTLELSAALHRGNDRLADRIFGVQKSARTQADRQTAISPQPTPLRQYIRSELFGLPGGVGQALTIGFKTSTQRHAA
ncbi:hypothetical protein ACWPKO_04400 [Coraliomargarita sp. W4R53]